MTIAADPINDVTEVRVAQGVYLPDRDEMNPDGTGDRTATFQFHGGVSLLGGYAGFGADDPDDRTVELYETILSGDLGAPFKKRSYHVITVSDAVSGTTIDGDSIVWCQLQLQALHALRATRAAAATLRRRLVRTLEDLSRDRTPGFLAQQLDLALVEPDSTAIEAPIDLDPFAFTTVDDHNIELTHLRHPAED